MNEAEGGLVLVPTRTTLGSNFWQVIHWLKYYVYGIWDRWTICGSLWFSMNHFPWSLIYWLNYLKYICNAFRNNDIWISQIYTYMILCCHRLVLKWDNHRSKFVILHHYQTTCKKFYAEHSYKCGNTFFPHSFTISFAVGKIHKYYTYRIHFDWWSFSPIVKLLPPRIVYFYRDRPLFQMFSGTEIATIGWLVRFGGG